MLQIRKKLQNVFKHFDTDLGDFLLSKGYFKIGKGKFQIIEDGGARRMLYSLSEITVYDDTASGFPETFLTDVALYNRLFELGYNLIDYNGVNPSTPTVYATESPIDAPFTGSNTFELPLNYILISVFLDVDLRIKAEYIRTPTGIIILDTLVDGNIISIRGFIASGSVVGGSVISVNDDDNGVVSVDNSTPTNPIVKFNGVFVDGTTVTGDGTEENPLVSVGGGGGVTINDETPSLTQTYSSEKSEDTFVKRSGTEVGKDIVGDLKFSNNAGLITEEFGGLQSKIYERNGKWNIEVLSSIDTPTFEFDAEKGFIADKLFDIDNDEKAYIQKGHIVQLEEDVFNLELNKLDASAYNDRFKGVFTTEAALVLAYPIAQAGDSAQVNETGSTKVVNYSWDAEDGIWVIGGSGGSVASNTDALPEGASNFYFTTARVLSTLLTGISFLTGGAIVSTDSVLVAFGKFQKQLNDFGIALGLKQDTLTDTNFGTFTNSVAYKNTQSDTDVLAYVDVTTGKWVKQTFTNLTAFLKGFFVDKTTAQSIDGIKTFTASPLIPNATEPTGAVNLQQLETKQDKPIIISANKIAVVNEVYNNVGSNTYTDPTSPTPVNGNIYTVNVLSGTTTIGGIGYTSGKVIRYFNGTVWLTENLNKNPLHAVFIDNNLDGSVSLTGTTASTILKSYVFPANYFPADCVVEVSLKISKTGTSGNMSVSFGKSVSGTTLPVNSVSVSSPNLQMPNISRSVAIKNGKMIGFGISGSYYSDNLAIIQPITKNDFDVTSSQTFNLTFQLGNASDTMILESLILKVYKNV